MRVVKVPDAAAGQPQGRLVDASGEPVVEVEEFLRLLTVRAYSPNTVRAYAHDLQKLYLFCEDREIGAAGFMPARAVEFLGLRLEDISYGQCRVTVRKRFDHPRGVQQKSRRDRVVDLHEGRAPWQLSTPT
ncbi:site-specific integrase [Kitasatospora sp. NPDC087861]|uniref:site-specific integrase n=1 Tax=Kitasatospora sp. NPDC087861 TaxID=3364070 RepID=UPI00380D3B02